VAAADSASRIEQFKKMAEADPTNELGHFSLGRAYLDAGQHADAVAALRRVVELNPNISKAYQLMADAQLKLNQRDEAIETLTIGVRIANDRGDLMPKNAMIATLQELGAPVPELASKAAATPVGEGQVLCQRCGKVKPRLPDAPFSNAQGKMIQEKICADCWKEWIGMGTKVINEMRLPLSDPQAQKIFDQHMMEFLNLK
jgi:Fe-S cluster biosynthesis and repair protein YggX